MPSSKAIEVAKAIMQGQVLINTDLGAKSVTGLALMFDDVATELVKEAEADIVKVMAELRLITKLMVKTNKNRQTHVTKIETRYSDLRRALLNIAYILSPKDEYEKFVMACDP